VQLTCVARLASVSALVAGAVADPAVLAKQPLGRLATPEDLAQIVSHCALDAPASMTGAIVDVNGASYLR
jgi:NAD(P)-dependent dehydrogenase (short-subunit alcohol dehydrogenase family)